MFLDCVMIDLDEKTLLELSRSADVEFTYNGYSAKITKNRYLVTNSLGKIVLDSQKHCYSFYELCDIILGENC